MKTNNKGLSLIELVVSMAILTVIFGVVVGLLSFCMRAYGKVSTDANVQNEAQLATNQIENLIIDCTNGIVYDESEKKLYIYNKDTCYVVIWDDANQVLNYREDTRVSGTTTFTEGTEALLAQSVTNFFVDVSTAQLNRNVKLDLSFKTNGEEKTYTANRNLTIRNKILVNSDLENMYVDDIAVSTTYESISMTIDGQRFMDSTETKVKFLKTWDPNDAESGELYVATLGASVYGNGYPSQDVTWTVSDPTAAEVRGGKLHVMKASEFTLTASSKGAAAEGETVAITVTVVTRQITGITVAYPLVGTVLNYGQSFLPQAVVTGDNVSGFDSCDWEVVSGAKKVANRCEVDSEGDKVVLRFVSKTNPLITKEVTYDKKAAVGGGDVVDNQVKIAFGATNPESIARGESKQLYLLLKEGLKEWNITILPSVRWTCQINTKGTASVRRGKLTVDRDVPKDTVATVTITASYTYNSKEYNASCVVRVPEASGSGGGGDNPWGDNPWGDDPWGDDPWGDDPWGDDPEPSETPGTSQTPGTSETPGTSQTPGTSETPGTSQTPGTSETPGTGETPGGGLQGPFEDASGTSIAPGSSWNNGGVDIKQFDATLTNHSGGRSSKWTLVITVDREVKSINGWNGSYRASGNKVIVTPADYNAVIDNGGNCTIGFQIGTAGVCTIQSAVITWE